MNLNQLNNSMNNQFSLSPLRTSHDLSNNGGTMLSSSGDKRTGNHHVSSKTVLAQSQDITLKEKSRGIKSQQSMNLPRRGNLDLPDSGGGLPWTFNLD